MKKNPLFTLLFFPFCLMLMAASCDSCILDPELATITTASVNSITANSAVSGGSITDDGRADITARGVCWNKAGMPSITDSKTTDGSGSGDFTSTISGLEPNTSYFVRAYATNKAGTAYGNELTFKTLVLTATDVDGNVYKTVTIGSQIWMAENLRTTKYRTGVLIGTTTPILLDVSGQASPKYQWSYGGNENNVATYGRLYTWYAATDSRGLCPTGWHLPSDAEWTTLSNTLGGDNIAGGKMKEVGTTHWANPNVGATNESGFTALSSGYFVQGVFYDLGSAGGGWWSSTEANATNANYRACGVTHTQLFKANVGKYVGWSVRCLKD